ncbi:MAG TPA: hypothetical protein VLW85_17140 [Myxococcales bacterium]|nr:hypothetical protein [Myxococcales bacterium]
MWRWHSSPFAAGGPTARRSTRTRARTSRRLLPRDPEFLLEVEPQVRHFDLVVDLK